MSVLLDADTTTVVLEGLDFDVPCNLGGDHGAELLMQCRFCESSGFYCVKHAADIRADAEAKIAASLLGMICCAQCRSMAFSFDDLIAVLPLGGGS